MVDLLQNIHPAVIHFPLAGILVAFGSGVIALLIGIFLDIAKYYEGKKKKKFLSKENIERAWRFIDRFEFTSWVGAVMGEGGLIIAGLSGIYASNGIDAAVNNKYLAFKVQLSIYLFFILLVPIMLKLYVGIVHKKSIFGTERGGVPPNPYPVTYRVPPALYLLTLAICAVLAVLIGGAGGKLVYGHSVLEEFGLGFLLPS